MGQVIGELGSQVKNDFLATNGEAHYEGKFFVYESVYTSSERLIGSLAVEDKVQVLREILEEGLGDNPDIVSWFAEEESAIAAINILITKVLEVELLESDKEVAEENARRHDAFLLAEDARYT